MISFLKKDLFFDRFLKFATKCPLSSKFSNMSLLDLPIILKYFMLPFILDNGSTSISILLQESGGWMNPRVWMKT